MTKFMIDLGMMTTMLFIGFQLPKYVPIYAALPLCILIGFLFAGAANHINPRR